MSASPLQRENTELFSIEEKHTSPRYDSFESGTTLLSRAAVGTENALDPKGPLGLNCLYAPLEPLIDLIFVHGLGGGSRKTWSKTDSEKDYWPQEWLPRDAAFSNVRIHSFGYNSDWGKGKNNCLNIHHFGKSLLSQLDISPYLTGTNTPIILIGHSMGGLVIKKAYISAKQDPAYGSLAGRIHTIYFLATPHKGSDSAKFLDNILRVASLSPDYVKELKENSGTLQGISDDFQNYSLDLDLWSFYETRALKIGKMLSVLIVPLNSAVLGFPHEKQILMNADHRSICKFDSPEDPNYQTLRNSLEKTVNNIGNTIRKSQQISLRREIEDLEKYLVLSEKPESDLFESEDVRMPGTCEWLSRKSAFLEWKDFGSLSPSTLWVCGNPGAGKSILASYAINHLQKGGANCSYFFFKSKSRLSAGLRSLAFQMARNNHQIRGKLLEMQKEDIKFDKENARTVWRKLFLSGIFQIKFPSHYWVIDALDECINPGALFDLILDSLDHSMPLRILITSRMSVEIENGFKSLKPNRYQIEQVSAADTLPDIKLLIQSKSKSFLTRDEGHRAALVDKILQKSNGSFLWTALVVKDLSSSHYSQEEIPKVLEDMPDGMKPLYQKTLEVMSQNERGHKLTGAILTWTTCAIRPLSLTELEDALYLDVNETSLQLSETVGVLCGQLVAIDKFGRTQVVHETVREFLLDVNLDSKFAIKPKKAHTRIAKACLKYLTGDEMKPPRNSRRGAALDPAANRKDFSQYACTSFSYHLAKADPYDDELLCLLDKFLKSNVLAWIEVIAYKQDLFPLIRVAKNLRTYLNARSTARSPLGPELQLIRGWSTDFIRIAARFADALVLSPSAIYSLIISFCPTTSSAYKTVNNGRRLQIAGLSNLQWEDRLCCIEFQQGQASALCIGDDYMAVGLTNGTIKLYHAASCQEYRILDHGEAVKFLQFKSKSAWMASCGMKYVRVWDVCSGERVYNFQAPQRPISLVFDDTLLITASHKNSLVTWHLEHDGIRMPDRLWNDSFDETETPLRGQPSAISISVSHKMLAVAYIGKPVILWDLKDNSFYGNCGKKLSNGETSTHPVSALVFNPNVNIGLLVASYLDGQLALLDPFNDREEKSFRADCHILAASPDGRLLAGGAGSGIVQVYEFETLQLLYRVKSSNLYIKQLAFAQDGLRFADIRGPQCNIWEPAVLLRDMAGDDSSIDSSSSLVEAISSDSKVKITSIALHRNGDVAFCGKDDGSISVYSLRTGAQMGTLYNHKSLVRIVSWSPKIDVIMSVDTSNSICAWKLKHEKLDGWKLETKLCQCRLDCGKSIIQVLQGEQVGKFVLSTRESDHFWNIAGNQEQVREYSANPGIRKWFQHPQSQLHMICIDGMSARIYAWKDWSEVACVPLNIDVTGLQLKSVITFLTGPKQQILLDLSELDGSASTRKVYIFDTASVDINDGSASNLHSKPADAEDAIHTPNQQEGICLAVSDRKISSQLSTLAIYVSHIIGITNDGKLVFLDIHSWVCSASLDANRSSSFSYTRHFFVPADWFSGIRDIICALTKRDVVFSRNDNLVVIKNGLDYVEKVDVDVHVEDASSNRAAGLLRSERAASKYKT